MTKRKTTNDSESSYTYEYMDEMLEIAVAEIYRVFKSYRALPFDELNVLPKTRELYTELKKVNRTAYKRIAKHYYNIEPHGKAVLPKLWLTSLLSTASPVMKYTYSNEIARRKDRLAEALTATGGDVTEYDRAMKEWSRLTGWFAIEVADAALQQARKDDGVTYVMWVTAHDERVCDECRELDRQIFRLEDVPPKPHRGCRCTLQRVKEGITDDD